MINLVYEAGLDTRYLDTSGTKGGVIELGRKSAGAGKEKDRNKKDPIRQDGIKKKLRIVREPK
jgi:hypothetical protein